MKLSELDSIAERISSSGLRLRTGPFAIALKSSIAQVGDAVSRLYADFEVVEDDQFVDFHVEVNSPTFLRRWMRPQAQFYLDRRTPFQPLPLAQGYPMLEWGLNWCIANHAHQYLILHAAVIARGHYAVILPGDPGAGKSTLCTALVQEGWDLLTDELCLVNRGINGSGQVGDIHGLARPINLKNDSIDLLSVRYPHAVFGPRCFDTAKGTVAHMKPPLSSVAALDQPARARHIIWPYYVPESPLRLAAMTRGETALALVNQSFNYNVLGLDAFKLLTDLVAECDTAELTYSSLDDAIAYFDSLELRASASSALAPA